MGLLTRHATLIQKAVGAAEAVVTLARLERGQSTANLNIQAPEAITLEEAMEELAAVQEVLAAAGRAPRALPPHVRGSNGVGPVGGAANGAGHG